MFSDKLIDHIRKTSPICVGLDPHLDKLPKYLVRDYSIGNAISKFNEEIIEAICDLVPIIKPQIAFYEAFGLEGLTALQLTIEYARSKNLLVLLDAKRNDIGSTAQAYADAYLKTGSDFEVDALTVTPYLGSDGIKPFIKNCKKYDKGIFTLIKTSNPSSGELQDEILKNNGIPIYEHIANLVSSWGQEVIGQNGYSEIGAVVGATYPEQATKLRQLLPQQIFLVPGYGAQGGNAQDVSSCFNENKEGAIVNSSRGIIFAYQNRQDLKEKDFALAARDAVLKMKCDIEATIG